MSYVIDFSNEKYPRYILRLRGTPNGIVDLCGNNVINHNVAYSTASSLGGGTALKFNGNNAYLQTSLQENIGHDDFTISMHVVNLLNWGTNSYRNPLFIGPNSGISMNIFMSMPYYNGGRYGVDTGVNFTFPVSSPSNTFHLAIVNNKGSIRCYYNGSVCDQTWNFGKRIAYLTGTRLLIGYYPESSHAYRYLSATLDDYCIIKGKALWISNFTPPTTYLPDRI